MADPEKDPPEDPEVEEEIDDPEEDPEEGGGGEGEESGDAKPSDTVSREELRKAIRARTRAKELLRDARKEISELRAKNETDVEKAAREAEERTSAAASKLYKPALVKATATAALLEAGVKRGLEGVPRLIRLMNLDDIDVSDNGDVDGVEAEIERLQEEYPELFGEETKPAESNGEPKPKRRVPGSSAADAGGKKPPAKKVSMEEKLMAKLRGEG